MFTGVKRLLRKWIGPESQPNSSGAVAAQIARIRGSYDASRTSDEYKNIWANADCYDADSAHSRAVRETLVKRSRYEINNNGFADGIAQTYATDIIGVGPTLRMQTSSTGFNQMVELQWTLWCKAVQFRRKLWCQAHAKHSDGESIAVLRKNPRIKHTIPLDIVLYETEQCQTPAIAFNDTNQIDGIRLDQYGTPIAYDILRYHPGATNADGFNTEPDTIAAERVLHWFKLRRPGQHRAVPECASTLNLGGAARRWREDNLAAADMAADYSLIVKTQTNPDDIDPVAPFSTMDVAKRQMAFLPMGWDANQLKAEFPTATFEAFHKSLINEQARPKSMPYNKAACDSSSYNYASGRLDHQTYYASLDVDREDCNDLVLDKVFALWFDYAILLFGWLGGDPEAVSLLAKLHSWDWPKHRVADVEAEANANDTKLKSGQIFIHRMYSDAGLDFEDEIQQAAQSFGVTVDEMRTRLFDIVLPGASAAAPAQPQQQVEDAVAAMLRRLEVRREGLTPKTNGSSHAH